MPKENFPDRSKQREKDRKGAEKEGTWTVHHGHSHLIYRLMVTVMAVMMVAIMVSC